MSAALIFEQYGNGSANRGVSRFAIAREELHVQFQDDRVYVYNGLQPGLERIERMKELARQGSGLSTYISKQVQHRYARWYRLSPDPSS